MKHCVLVDLDAILDTRIGVLAQHDIEASIEALDNGWRTRLYNDISLLTDKISYEEYKQLWENRTSEVLLHSRPTNFIFELINITRQLEENIILDKGLINDGCFIINIHPYDDLDDDVLNEIVNVFKHYIGDGIPVKVASFSPDKLDLPFLKSHGILTYIVQDYTKWLREAFHPNKGQKCFTPYPKLTVIAPVLIEDKDSLSKISASEKEFMGKQTPFDMMRIFWAPLFGFQFYPIELFSLLDLGIIKD